MVGMLIFVLSFCLMVYYGKETFYVENKATTENVYDHHIVLITEEVGNDYWHLIENGARDEALNHNIYLEYIGPKRSDNDENLQTFDRMISAKVDGIIIQGLPGERFKNLMDKADENSIPVVNVDTDVPDSQRKAYVGTDNYQAGFLAGQTLIGDTSGDQFVGVVVGMFDALNQQDRLKGFKDAIATVNRIKLVAIEESNITEIGAAQATYSLLKQYPNINALFGTSALDGIGIAQGVEEMNPTTYPYILAFDTLPETLELIEQEKIAATIVQYPYEMGRLAVLKMVELQQKRTVEPLNYTNTGVVRKETIKNGEILQSGDGF